MKYGPLSLAMFAATKVLVPLDSEEDSVSYHSSAKLTWRTALHDAFRCVLALMSIVFGLALTIGGTALLCGYFKSGWMLLAGPPLATISIAFVAKVWEWSTRP